VSVSVTGAGAAGAVSVATAVGAVSAAAAAGVAGGGAAVAAGALSVVDVEAFSSPELLLHAAVAVAPISATITTEPRLILIIILSSLQDVPESVSQSHPSCDVRAVARRSPDESSCKRRYDPCIAHL
jgi:hypothetical protein